MWRPVGTIFEKFDMDSLLLPIATDVLLNLLVVDHLLYLIVVCLRKWIRHDAVSLIKSTARHGRGLISQTSDPELGHQIDYSQRDVKSTPTTLEFWLTAFCLASNFADKDEKQNDGSVFIAAWVNFVQYKSLSQLSYWKLWWKALTMNIWNHILKWSI